MVRDVLSHNLMAIKTMADSGAVCVDTAGGAQHFPPFPLSSLIKPVPISFGNLMGGQWWGEVFSHRPKQALN